MGGSSTFGSGVRRFFGSDLFDLSMKLTPSLNVQIKEQTPLQHPRFLEQLALVAHGSPLVLCSSIVTAYSAAFYYASLSAINLSKLATVC